MAKIVESGSTAETCQKGNCEKERREGADVCPQSITRPRDVLKNRELTSGQYRSDGKRRDLMEDGQI
jgi:hypothetical protein